MITNNITAIRTYQNIRETVVTINRGELSAGVYVYRLKSETKG
ncbi:MAG: hypothetical protein ACI8P3_003311 [Saprospiraceae bacterium]|jgi:hypothetical protein